MIFGSSLCLFVKNYILFYLIPINVNINKITPMFNRVKTRTSISKKHMFCIQLLTSI